MGRAGLQHRRNYCSDTDGFQPSRCSQINTYNTAHCHTNNCIGSYPEAYTYPMADLPPAAYNYLDAYYL